MRVRSCLLAGLVLLVLGGCATSEPTAPSPEDGSSYDEATLENMRRGTYNDAWESSYEPLPARPTVIRDATVMTAAGETIEEGDVLLRDRTIDSVGTDVPVPEGARVVDGTGKYVTPGLIDSHSHLGVTATPEVGPHYDNN